MKTTATTAVGYAVEPTSVGTEAKEWKHHKSVNPPSVPYEIKCRLNFHKYSKEAADLVCLRVHGTRFDGQFVSGSYFVYYKIKTSNYYQHRNGN